MNKCYVKAQVTCYSSGNATEELCDLTENSPSAGPIYYLILRRESARARPSRELAKRSQNKSEQGR